MNIRELAIARKMFGGSGGVVTCNTDTPSKENPIKSMHGLRGLRISYPNATSVDNRAFYNFGSGLKSIDLPKATSIGDEAFYQCGLTSVNLPNVTSVGNRAFTVNALLTSISLPNANDIGEYAFSDCYKLTNVNLPKAISIGNGAFNCCVSLTSVNLPNTTSIGESVFTGCDNLQGIILRTTETVCEIHPFAFAINTDENGIPTKLLNVYVPTSMYEYYRSAYEPAFAEYGFDGYFDVLFHKIEEHPEFCG